MNPGAIVSPAARSDSPLVVPWVRRLLEWLRPHTSTKTRLALLLGTLLAGFGATAGVLRSMHVREADAMLANLRREREQLLQQVTDLSSRSLRNFAADYSNWDEMLAFVGSGDRSWAAINLDASLQTFNVNAAWVLRPDGSLVYGTTRQLDDRLREPPWSAAPLLARLRTDHFARFFVDLPAGVLEVRAGPIQPSSDVARTTAPQGWFLVGQLWSAGYLQNVGRVLDSDLSIFPPDTRLEHPADDPGLHLEQMLAGLDGRPVALLHAYYHPEPLVRLLEDNRNDMYVFYAFGIIVITLTFLGVSRWVINPLRQLEASMAGNSAAPLGGLLGQADEFGRLARMTEAAFRQRTELKHEVEEHNRTEAALRESEAELRRSVDLRTRLARDLHDGVIQSIYAAGLGLESARAELETDPTAAVRRLGAVRDSLNLTIRDVRGFITGLEPEGIVGFAQALQTLATTMEALHPVHLQLQIDPAAASRLSARDQLHALQIVRESISNAVRHGGAAHITLQLQPEDTSVVLALEDDGRGFDPDAISAGSGLINVSARAREMGATLQIKSEPTQGTRLILKFNPQTR
ncbi:MAG TPA: CHASE4 domain-containing protein [Lacunisphaera sp.]|nr:CHASE4 domain-containing protein [Lacunisphaera sp.]